MKKYSNYIIIALMVINIFSILKINNLENSMDNYYNQIISGVNRNNSEISNIYSNINSILEKQDSLIDSYSSKSLRDFIYECNNGKDIFFLFDENQAIEKLSSV